MGSITAATVIPKSHLDTSPAPFSLGLKCSPSMPLVLVSGKTYSLSLGSGIGHRRILYAIIEANLTQGRTCALMTPMAPALFFQRAEKQCRSRLEGAVSSGQLRLLTMMGDYQHNLARFGPEKLTREWAQCQVAKDSLLIIDHAEQIFTLHHPDLASAQVGVYKQWIEAAQCSTLFVFPGKTDEGQASAGYHRVLNNLDGNGRVDCYSKPASIWIDVWDAGSEILSEQRLELVEAHYFAQRSGNIPCDASSPPSPATSCLTNFNARDTDDVFCLGGESPVFCVHTNLRWRHVRDLIDLLHATREAKAAVVLIHVFKDTNWLHLAQAVHTMRQHCGAHLRIAILDPGCIMRYQTELLLLRLGANTVAHGRTATVKLPLLLESLRAQQYLPDTAVSFDQAVVSATPPHVAGYLAPKDFSREARSALARSGTLGVPCILLLTRLPPGKDRIAAIGRFKLPRHGDMVTANSTNCYVFLYGCTTADVASLLPRILDAQEAHAARDISFISDPEAIVAVLNTVEEENRFVPHGLGQVVEASVTFDQIVAGAN